METSQPPLAETLSADNKRQCIRIKARIKIHGEQDLLEPTSNEKLPFQAYCETVTSSRPQSPDVFTTPPTHSAPFHPVQAFHAPTYTARITTRKTTASRVSTSPSVPAPPKHGNSSIEPAISTGRDSKQDAAASRVSLQGSEISRSLYHAVSQSTAPRGSHSGGTADDMLRNHTPSLSQVQQANTVSKPTSQVTMARTPLQHKRFGRMDYHPLPPLPPSPPDTPINPPVEKQTSGKTTVNFSRGKIKRKSPQPQEHVNVPHLTCVNAYTPPPALAPPIHHPVHLASVTAEYERSQSKASRRTVTFADDTTLSSRSSSPEHHDHNHTQDRSLRQSKSFSSDAQVPSSLRLYRSHDSLLTANNNVSNNSNSTHASRRTTPKDFKHKYTFGQRPTSRMTPSPALGRTNNPNYNPRLSTSKAQYRGLATLPRPLPSSLRVAEPQTGPRQPPWGSLEDLEEQRGKRGDARERDQAKQFRAATLSEATTLGSTDSFGQERMKREVEEYKEQVMSVYPEMAFDGNAGKGGRRSCCCAVM